MLPEEREGGVRSGRMLRDTLEKRVPTDARAR